jgi:hypothetical protein
MDDQSNYGNSTINVSGSQLGTSLQQLLMCDEIQPGAEPSYHICKTIYLFHPLGAKMVESPIRVAMSQERAISIPKSPESMVKDAFLREWEAIMADKHIFNVMRQSRTYGVATIVYGADGVPTDRPIDPKELHNLTLYFNVLDPLNTSGSLVLNQNPNAPDFQKHISITSAGKPYHRSRTCVMMNEEPIYIAYTSSAFGYVGRSVYQRALFPMKSFVQSMITDDMVSKKAGLLVAKMKPQGSITDRLMMGLANIKRNVLKQAMTNNVISIAPDEDIETLNMQNTDAAMTSARKNILDNIATSADIPVKIINGEPFTGGLANGTEDYKQVVQYVQGLREEMRPLYDFFDKIVKYRAWNPEFYKTVQAEYPEYESISYTKAFYDWMNSFEAQWPSLLEEPESEKIKVEETKFKAIIGMLDSLLPTLDPENVGALVQWACDNLNEEKMLFTSPLILDIEALQNYEPPVPVEEPAPGNKADSSLNVARALRIARSVKR